MNARNGNAQTGYGNGGPHIGVSDNNTGFRSSNQQLKGGRKRTRNDAELETTSQSRHEVNARRRRKQTYRNHIECSKPDTSGMDEGSYVPVIDVEDISSEVETRLRLKELTRQNVQGKRERKRKRDSTGSASQDATAVQAVASHRKKARIRGAWEDASAL